MSDASRYLLLDRLAVGGMAEVYRAKSLGIEGFEKIIAMKRVLPQLAQDPEFVEMFIEEAKIAGQLQHANIAQIYELGKVDDVHFIAMEYVFGKNVRQLLDAAAALGARLPCSLAAYVCAQVLGGLDYAHRKRDGVGRPLGIIHRDVSPPNVIVSYDGLVKIVDFGIAKAASRAVQTVAGVIKGKLAYMSPEQLMGEPLDHRSDVFAASALLHELLTGERLFAGSSDFDITERVRTAKADPPSLKNPDVPPALDEVVMRGLTRRREERWSTAGEMQEALIAAVARPGVPFGAAAMKDWMRTTFAEDHGRERARLDRLLAVRSEGVAIASEPPPLPELGPDPGPAAFEDATLVEPVEDLLSREPSGPGEVSSVIFVEESFGAFARPDAFAPPEADPAPPASSAPPPLPASHPDPAPDPAPAPAPDPDPDPDPGPVSGPDPAADPVSGPSSAPKSTPTPTPLPPAPHPSQAPTQTVAQTTPRPDASRPPSIPFQTHTSAAHAPPRPEPESGRPSILLLFLVAVLALALGVGGVVAALYFTGHPLPL